MNDFPVVVVGSGPIRLAGPVPRERESTPLVLERGAALARYHGCAERVEPVLPDTGVCDGAGVFDDTTSEQTADAAAGGGGCWGGAATTAQAPLTAPTAPQQLPFIAPAR
ncbi:hypothetical protein [Nocardia xishanensis]|uniref:hypothetical protein n=1 Tax=Nocardia xishanensis TaxID=238964 RepID=UPI00082CB674|nr:hypothetical protein [Nocardia xishanensis]